MSTERYFTTASAEELRAAARTCRFVRESGGDPDDWDAPEAAEARRWTRELGWTWDFTDWDDAATVIEAEAVLAAEAEIAIEFETRTIASG